MPHTDARHPASCRRRRAAGSIQAAAPAPSTSQHTLQTSPVRLCARSTSTRDVRSRDSRPLRDSHGACRRALQRGPGRSLGCSVALQACCPAAASVLEEAARCHAWPSALRSPVLLHRECPFLLFFGGRFARRACHYTCRLPPRPIKSATTDSSNRSLRGIAGRCATGCLYCFADATRKAP